MAIERTYHCDGPDCEVQGSDQFPGWVLVTQHSYHPGEPPTQLQFCCWDCVLKYAAPGWAAMARMTDLSKSGILAAVDDPAWLRSKYEEAKELLSELRVEPDVGRLPADLRERIEEFWLTTFMDRCTTMGRDCGCNGERS